MSSDESDIEMQTALPKKPLKKAPKSPTADILKKQDYNEKQESKKISTKEMVNQALLDLKSRKGTSLYAIKKYIEDKYKVDVEKLNHFIKKYLKTSVELGTIVQVKGVGAAGSFKLAPGQEKSKKKKKPAKKPEETSKTEKPKTKPVKEVELNENKAAKKAKKVEMLNSKKVGKNDSDVKKKSNGKKEKAAKAKMAKVMQTPAKKRAALMKRKSIGSIIKPPKMKPAANV